MIESSRDPDKLHPTLRVCWSFMKREWWFLYPNLPQPFITCTTRSQADQSRLLSEGKSRAKFGESLHNFHPAFAFDLAFARPDQPADWSFHLFDKMAAIAEPLGLVWGGRWKGLVDGPHFQMPMTWQQAVAGEIPALPPMPTMKELPPPTDDGWKLVIEIDGKVTIAAITPYSEPRLRVAPHRKRIYLTLKEAS